MGNALECGAGDGQPAAMMITDMIEGGNTLVCADHWIALCVDMATAAAQNMPAAPPEPAATAPEPAAVPDTTPAEVSAVQGAAEGDDGPPAWPMTEHRVPRGRAAAHKRRTGTKHATAAPDPEGAGGPPRGTDVPADYPLGDTPPEPRAD